MANMGRQAGHGRWHRSSAALRIYAGSLAALLCGLTGAAPASGAAMAFIPIGAYNQVVTINLSNNQVVGYTSVGVNPIGIAVSQTTPRAYVANWGNNSVSVLDTDTRAVVGTITVQNNPRGIAVSPDGGTVYVANLTSNSVSEIDAATHQIRRSIPIADSPASIVFDPWGTLAYVARLGAGRVAVIDTATGAVVADPIACQFPNTLAMHPSGALVFATCPDSSTVAAIDTTTLLVARTWSLGSRPQGVAVSPDGARLYVTRAEASSLVTIDLASGHVVGEVSVPSGNISRAWSVAVGPDGTRAYTTDLNGPHVSVVDTANQSLVTQVLVGATWLNNGVQSVGQFIGGRGILGAPVIGTATADDARVSVRFSPPVFQGSLPIIEYTASCGSQSATGTTSPILVTGLPNGVPVTCQVIATNALGNSPPSAPSNEVTPNVPEPPPTPPPPPQLLSVTPVASQTADVAFVPLPPGGTLPVLEYEAQCTPGIFAFRGADSPITVIGLPNGLEHQCGVRARNAIGWGPLSSTLPVTTATVPTLPPLISATGGVGQITLVFEPPQLNGGAPILEYIGRCGSIEASGAASPIIVSGLSNGLTYACVVFARNWAGLSPPSNTKSAFVGLPPDAPVLDAATPGPGQIALAFTPPASDGGLPIEEYLARCGDTTASSSASPIIVSGLVNGTEVSCTVRARNLAGTGPESNALMATPRAPPGTPQIIQADAADQEIQLRVAVPPDNGSPILHYQASCSLGQSALSDGAVPIVRLLGLVNGQSYTCTVEAVNAIGTSPPSHPVTLVPAGPPGPPTLLALVSQPSSLSFQFEPPTFENGAPISGYEFVCNRNGTLVFTTVPVQPSPFTFTGLVAGVPHECWIHAQNRGGSSEWSNRLTATPAAPPEAPVLNSVAPLDGGARLAFDPPNNSGGAPVLDYEAECVPGPASNTGGSAPIDVTGLVNNQVHRCRVRARNIAGMGPYSAALAVIPGAFPSTADLAVTKTNGVGFVNGAALVDYDIVVTNAGPAAVVDARVEDPLTADFVSGVWQCVATNGAECPASGTDGIDVLVALPIGSSVHFTFSVLPALGPESPISNLVWVTPPPGIDDPNLANNVASDGPDIRGIFRDGFE